MWFTILFGLVLLGFYFLKDINKLKKETAKRGGMKVRYAILIKLLLEGDSRAKIYSETSTLIILGVEGIGAYTKFEVQQAFDVVIVKWESNNNFFGLQKSQWKFKDDMNQDKIFEIICNDIAVLNN